MAEVTLATPMPRAPTSRWRLALRVLFALGSLVAVLWIFTGGDPARLAELRTSLYALGPVPFVLGGVGTLVLVWMQALRWRVVARSVLPMSVADLIRAIVLGQMLNVILPARAGDLLRVQYLGDRLGASRATILGTEIADIWIDKVGWLPVLAAFAITGGLPPWLVSGTLALLATTAVLAVVVFLARKVQIRSLGRLAVAWERVSSAAASTGLKSMLGPALLLASAGWLYEAWLIQLVSHSAGVALTLAQSFAVLTALNVALVAPTPGHVGAYEAASVFAMTSFGISTGPATALAIAYHASQLVVYVAGGIVVSLLGAQRAAAPSPSGGER